MKSEKWKVKQEKGERLKEKVQASEKWKVESEKITKAVVNSKWLTGGGVIIDNIT